MQPRRAVTREGNPVLLEIDALARFMNDPQSNCAARRGEALCWEKFFDKTKWKREGKFNFLLATFHRSLITV